MLFTLLCTVGILHCILRRQQRRDVEGSPHFVTLHVIPGSESYDQEKDNDVVAPTSKYRSFETESGYSFKFSHLGLSSIEKASESDLSNRMIPCLFDVS